MIVMENDLYVIYLPMWLELTLAVGGMFGLWKLVNFSDTSVPDCGWCGHQD